MSTDDWRQAYITELSSNCSRNASRYEPKTTRRPSQDDYMIVSTVLTVPLQYRIGGASRELVNQKPWKDSVPVVSDDDAWTLRSEDELREPMMRVNKTWINRIERLFVRSVSASWILSQERSYGVLNGCGSEAPTLYVGMNKLLFCLSNIMPLSYSAMTTYTDELLMLPEIQRCQRSKAHCQVQLVKPVNRGVLHDRVRTDRGCFESVRVSIPIMNV